MKVKIKDFIRNNILLIFVFLVLFLLVTGIIYYLGLNPGEKSILKIINKYKTEDY
jgi:CHASE3 domain sensor protein